MKNAFPQISLWCPLSETERRVDGPQISANAAFRGFLRHKRHIEVLLKQSWRHPLPSCFAFWASFPGRLRAQRLRSVQHMPTLPTSFPYKHLGPNGNTPAQFASPQLLWKIRPACWWRRNQMRNYSQITWCSHVAKSFQYSRKRQTLIW